MRTTLRPLFLALLASFALTGCQGNFEERLREEAQQYTQKHCPQMLDGVTQLDSVAFDLASRTYIRYMTIPAEVAAVAKSKPATVKSTLLEELKNDASWKKCKDHAINFRYVYREAGNPLPVITITLKPSDYTSTSPR